MKRTLIVWCAVSVAAVAALAQSTFQNLDFESARLLFTDPPFNRAIAPTNALPDWMAFSGSDQLSAVPYGAGGVFYPVMLSSQTNGGSLGGFFSVVLSGAGSAAGSISQTAQVPLNARSLLFMIGAFYYGPFSVSVDGQNLSFRAMSATPNYTLYGADISTFEGQTTTLAFESLGGITILDDIQFSSEPIPEPGVLALLLLGGGVLLCWRRGFR